MRSTVADRSTMGGPVHVAVAVIEDGRGRVLLSKRPDHAHQGGLWEFPGGKLEAGEDLAYALCRELDEELGITVMAHRPLITLRHDYDDKAVILDVHRVTAWDGVPIGREGQPLAWVDKGMLSTYSMPAADRPIINALRLPDRYLITGADDIPSFIDRLEQALANGVRLVQLRLPAATVGLQKMLTNTEARCAAYGADLLVNSGIFHLLNLSDDTGIHLTSKDLGGLISRPDTCGFVACSCHNGDELDKAGQIGADFAVLSPVKPTSSHPDAQPLGWQRFAEMVREVAFPVYALGGVGRFAPEVAWRHGGQGIAGIHGLW